MSVKIIVDSAVDMSEKYCGRANIVPLTVRFGNEEYRDKVELDAREFYAKLIESDVIPTTSQANISQFSDVFEREVNDGNDVDPVFFPKIQLDQIFSDPIAFHLDLDHGYVL